MSLRRPARPSRAIGPATCVALLCMGGCGGRAAARAVAEPAGLEATSPATPPAPQREAGVYHVLLAGQTLYALHRAYGVPVSVIEIANGVTDPTRIPAGTSLFIPGADHVLPVPVPGAPLLDWPLRGRITSGFGARGESAHDGIDIDGEWGQEVRAAAAGTVLRAGIEGRYGKMILLDHGGGLTTFYAHASELLVREGDDVQRGDLIARVGRSGNARGTHLHFEARVNGRSVDPFPFLGGSGLEAAASR